MTAWDFDTVVRRTAKLLDRRSLIGLLGTTIAARKIGSGSADAADKKKYKKNKKMCKKDFKSCSSYSVTYCNQYYDSPDSDQCVSETMLCCDLLKKCTKKSYDLANACADLVSW